MSRQAKRVAKPDIIINGSLFLDSLKQATKMVNNKSPINEYVVIRCSKKHKLITFACFNQQEKMGIKTAIMDFVGITSVITVNSDKRVCFPATKFVKLITEIISDAKKQKLDNALSLFIDEKDNGLTIKCSVIPSEFILLTTPPTDYYEDDAIYFTKQTDVYFEEDLKLKYDTFNGKQLSTMLEQVKFGSAPDNLRQNIYGINLTVTNTGMRTLTTNGHILVYKDLNVDLITEKTEEYGSVVVVKDSKYSFLIPLNNYKYISSLLKVSSQINIAYNKENGVLAIKLMQDQKRVTTSFKVMDARDCPDYQSIMLTDKQFNYNAILDRQELANILKRLKKIVKGKKTQYVKLSFNPNNEVLIRVVNQGEQEGNTILPVKYTKTHNLNDTFECAFNSNYLFNCVSKLKGKEVHINWIDNLTQFLLHSEDSNDFKSYIMPVRVNY